MIGNEEIVGALTQFKSNTDYGVFYQFKSGMCCTKKWCCFCEKNRGIYQERRDTLVDGFRTFGWNVENQLAVCSSGPKFRKAGLL